MVERNGSAKVKTKMVLNGRHAGSKESIKIILSCQAKVEDLFSEQTEKVFNLQFSFPTRIVTAY